MDNTSSETSALRAKLKGQILHIPDLRPIFFRWSSAISPHYEGLAEVMKEELVEFVPNPNIRVKMEEINLPLWACLWWPMASFERLHTMILYTLWLFLWDDDLDGADNNLSELLEQVSAELLHDRTLTYLQFHLGMSSTDVGDAEPRAPPYAGIAKAAAENLRAGCSKAQLKRLLKELKLYMDCCLFEQGHLNGNTLPTVEGYWAGRYGSSAVSTYTALSEYMIGGELPKWVSESDELQSLWAETNRNISYVNDMISLKKEMDASIYSIIPVTMKETGKTLRAIIPEFVQNMSTSADAFDRAAQALLELARGESAATRQGVEQYVQALETMMTGNLYWSLSSDRYGVSKYLEEDGSLVIPL